MNFTPTPRPAAPPSFAADFAIYATAVAVCLSDSSRSYHVPETGDFGPHAQEIAERLMTIDPTGFAAFILHRAAGDEAKTAEGLHAALMTAFEIDENMFTINGANAKALNRFVLRRVTADRESADSMADYAGIPESRASAYQICSQNGWRASDMIAEAIELDAAIRQAAVDRERKLAEDSLRRIRIKSRGGDAAKDYHQREPRISHAPRVLTSR